MDDDGGKPAPRAQQPKARSSKREAALAKALRENLRRRKAAPKPPPPENG
ncbi:MAG: hypothetical protein ACXW3D_05665 [Caulobacteraceae bacterium]